MVGGQNAVDVTRSAMCRCRTTTSDLVTRAELSVLRPPPKPGSKFQKSNRQTILSSNVSNHSEMGQTLTKLQKTTSSHVPAYQQSLTVRRAAENWQAARQRRMTHLSLQGMSFGTSHGMETKFTWAEEIKLRYGFPELSQLYHN